jgi:uncharacterized membrane protein YhaH (DUF805 family)
MTFGQSIATVFRKYAEFGGRASRPEFWWWILFIALTTAALNALLGSPDPQSMTPGSGLATAWSVATLLPTLAVTVRRLRDIGLGWGHVFWYLVPIGGLVVLAILCSRPPKA